MKFLCLAYEEQAALDGLSDGQWRELRQETLDYVGLLRDRGVLVDAMPLQSAATSATLRVRDGLLSVMDGPYIETKEQIGGFFVVEAPDQDAAIEIAAKWPSARLGTIEVRPIAPELRLDRRYQAPPG